MDERVLNTLRGLSVDIINNRGIGHTGIALSAAPLIYTIYKYHLKFFPTKPTWINRDRFIMSPGHASALLYAMNFLSGYKITLEDLKNFRTINSPLKGHPEYNPTLGIELTTGPLGQGFASSVGIALGEEYLRNVISRELFDFYTYVLVSDGDLMEGISYEAASLAGSLKLGKLIVLYDSNEMSLDGSVKGVFEDDTLKLFSSLGWDTHYVDNSEDIMAINKAIIESKNEKNKPSIIKVKTVLGYKSPLENKKEIHAGVLNEEQTLELKRNLGLKEMPFFISKEPIEEYRKYIYNRNIDTYNAWNNKYDLAISKVNTRIITLLENLHNGDLRINLNSIKINEENRSVYELRKINGDVISLISEMTPLFLGGSADTSSSTKTIINGSPFLKNDGYGKNIKFGVREGAMSAILNGLATLNLRPFGSTFLTFSDYMKPGIRQSAIMNLPVTYIFTHDSFMIGSDGITHQPIEQLGTLRSIPNMYVFRPCDVNELIGSYDYIINNRIPACLIVTKEKTPSLNLTSRSLVSKGAYVLKDTALSKLDGIIVASGYETHTALILRDKLLSKGISTKIVSMPSLELFEQQSKEYQESVLPRNMRIAVLEPSNDTKWLKFVNDYDSLINITEYADSDSKEVLEKLMKYDIDSLTERVINIFKKK